MTEPIAVLLIKSEFPKARVRMRLRVGTQPQYVVYFNGLQAYDFLKAIKPFVLVKWEQVKVGLTFLVHKRRTKNSKKHYPCLFCSWAFDRIAALKVPDCNGVKTVKLVRLNGLRQYRAKPEEVEQDCLSIEVSLKELRERVETRLSTSTCNKAISAPEQEIVQAA